jgi:lipopolysaccharide/colanic/teichoic acid biosynthesis glycosyltransferase
MAKRIFDLGISGIALLVLLPLFVGIALWIKLDSPGPVLFRQERVGRYGRIFRIHKFRTMVHNANSKGLKLTVGNDARVTRAGGFLRRYKIDELPQLIDVLFGYMSMVGPRPEVPQYVAYYPDNLRELVLTVRPGITDLASIEYRDENERLRESLDPEKDYIEYVLPAKLDYYRAYALDHSFWGDLRILCKTVKAVYL